ncbi:VOC family protein [Chitinolyticbacter meiyuanensis]|uniref:VOC family protein n=1 Tax=Chitinolyticbacter meiyuanensis TaxID=682798 RepID=UPI0011E60601|nr:VOC family protein [Chitinolyticbacter meiyuanensis]
MSRQIFVNLPVRDLPRTKEFFAALGFEYNAQFTNEQAACMVVSNDIYVMLLVEEFFKTFTAKKLVDAHSATEVLVCLSCDSRSEVDALVAKAVAAGGKIPRPPQDYGFMYGHAFEDLDGHIWELAYMDMSQVPPQL